MIHSIIPSVGKPANKATLQKSKQFDGQKIRNQSITTAGNFGMMPEIIKTYMTRKVEASPQPTYDFDETCTDIIDQSDIQINWLGHAALLLHFQGKYILMDPMLSERASPFSFMGPKRYHPSPISADDLPDLDVVLLSHDHYDHLDYQTIKRIRHKAKKFIAPIGVGPTLQHWGIENEHIVELDWWESIVVDDFKFTAAPARHFSGRLFTRDRSLWSSWSIEMGDQKVYFGGDSGIHDNFQAIGEALGPFDISLMPIGAYHHLWHNIHLNPEEAIEAFQAIDGGIFVPIHWGTFDLAPHSWYDPILRTVENAALKNVPLITPKPGQWFNKRMVNQDHYWWEAYSETYNRQDMTV